jgi:hypothetical protein
MRLTALCAAADARRQVRAERKEGVHLTQHDCGWFTRSGRRDLHSLLHSAPSEAGHAVHFHGELLIVDVDHEHAAATVDARRMSMDLKKGLVTT